LKSGLNTYYALPFYFTVTTITVDNIPMPAMEFDWKVIMIFNGDPVGKHVLPRYRV
jgi:hypothetical protein